MEEEPKPSDSVGEAAGANQEGSRQPQKNSEKRRRGRPAVKIDLIELEKLASLLCTDQQIGNFFNVKRRTITRKKKQREFREALERGRAKGQISARRRLFQIAQSDKPGNVTAAIYLDKLFSSRDDWGFLGS